MADYSETDVKPVAKIVAGADQERLINTIRAHIAKGDHASKKAEQLTLPPASTSLRSRPATPARGKSGRRFSRLSSTSALAAPPN
jgi:hypothetical protein